MNERYSAPVADQVWSKTNRIKRLRRVTDAYATKRAINSGLTNGFLGKMLSGPDPTIAEWEKKEREHGHEIVGFLDAYLAGVPKHYHHLFHYGLTSSDLTEYDLHEAVAEHSTHLLRQVQELARFLRSAGRIWHETPRAGRTHGQTAELTFLGHQLDVHAGVFDRIESSLHHLIVQGSVTKSPGPTGWSSYWSEQDVGWRMVPSTQVVPRDHLVEWMMVYQRLVLALENLALWVRCGARSEIGEFTEGKRRVGSSAMPRKRNPIDSEKVCGLARVARGYFLAIMESASLWEDRDLSNSSAERISVRGLAALAEHMTDTMTDVIKHLEIDAKRMEQNAIHPATRMNEHQMRAQDNLKLGPIEASAHVERNWSNQNERETESPLGGQEVGPVDPRSESDPQR